MTLSMGMGLNHGLVVKISLVCTCKAGESTAWCLPAQNDISSLFVVPHQILVKEAHFIIEETGL